MLIQQLSKLHILSFSLHSLPPISTCPPARNIRLIFDFSLSFTKQISSLSISCHYHIRELRCIRHFGLQNCFSNCYFTCTLSSWLLQLPYYSLPKTQLHLLQSIQYSPTWAVAPLHASTSHYIGSKLNSVPQYKITYTTHNVLHRSHLLSYLRCLSTPQPPDRSRSSNCPRLALPSLTFRLVFRPFFSKCLTTLWNGHNSL